MASDRSARKDKNQNIQVFVRLRPLNQRERDIKSIGVVEVSNNREVVVRQSHQTNLTKKFTFDRAFCPEAKQAEVFHEVVRPLIDEVLAGYNCTVFAYGQTGTGKTHTMIGEPPAESVSWQNDPQAGIIPRSLSQLFDELRLSNTEYTVRVSYLELYNEELIDLLAPPNADSSKLRIYEDVSRKGANIVNGLEEIVVTNKNEVYKIMAQGAAKKRVASTNMNEQSSNLPNDKAKSSRSHTVFTITIHMKENSPEGEELVKIGKLNLVDLAGSENISKAGSDNPAKRERARECVNINQSLLTLGRVITALVERHPHIPYRESKLTRILQESLGGRTKTSIIATISPGHKDLEETMSTLEYAHRAKNIQNKPEVNQKLTRKAVLKEYSDEIYKLKQELAAARDKNGIYLPPETYHEMTFKEKQQNKEIQELILKKRALEEQKKNVEALFAELDKQLQDKNQELNSTKNKLLNTKEKLANTANMLSTTRLHFEEQKHLVDVHRSTESKLSEQARQIMTAAEVAATHTDRLHDTIDRRRMVESTNLEITRMCREEASKHRQQVSGRLREFVHSSAEEVDAMQQDTDNYVSSTSEIQTQDKQKIKAMVQRCVDDMNELNAAVQQSKCSLSSLAHSQGSQLDLTVRQHNESLHEAMRAFVEGVTCCLQRAQDVDVTGHLRSFVQQWGSDIGARVASLKRVHCAYSGLVHSEEDRRLETAQRARDGKRARLQRRNDVLAECIHELNKEKELIQQRSQLQVADIVNERKESELRLTQWFEEEKKRFEEQKKRFEEEKKRLEASVQKKMAVIAEEQKHLEEIINRRIEEQKTLLEECEKEMEYADEDFKMSTKDKEDCLTNVTEYSKEFDTGVTTISIDMEAFSQSVVQLVERLRDSEIQALAQARDDVQKQMSGILASEDDSTKQFMEQMINTLEGVVCTNKGILDDVLHKVKASNSVTTAQLQTLSSSLSSMGASSRAYRDALTARLDKLRTTTVQFDTAVTTDIRQQDETDELYLEKEYRVYCPSGNTPARQEYSFPRQLIATSPHERILARFRAMRNNADDEDCVVVEDESAGTSDSESAVSEDSAVATNCTPPQSVVHEEPDPHRIVKCTSDSDIYKHPQEGKENPDRRAPSSCRKPSKLPAPQFKKPLLERNVTH